MHGFTRPVVQVGCVGTYADQYAGIDARVVRDYEAVSDLVAKVLAPENVDTRAMVVSDVMRSEPKTMAPETYMYEAMAYMTRHGLNYLPIVDRGQLVGVITPRDLLRYRSQKALLLLGNIKEEESVEGLASIHKEIVRVARALLFETRSTPEVMEILSHIHHAIIRRTYQVCLAEMAAEGIKPPDIRYCFLMMGSAGRKEMLLHPDQDNGFIITDYPDRLRQVAIDLGLPVPLPTPVDY